MNNVQFSAMVTFLGTHIHRACDAICAIVQSIMPRFIYLHSCFDQNKTFILIACAWAVQ